MTVPGYTITLARTHDLPQLAAVEIAAARLLEGHAPPDVLEGSLAIEELQEAQTAGRLWVALATDTDAPVGYAIVEMLAEDWPHLEEIDVHPSHGRRGLGAALVREVCDWAARSGYPHVTLTTFRAVPWNMPFYARMGFEEMPMSSLEPEIAAVVQREAERGLDVERRVAMRFRTER